MLKIRVMGSMTQLESIKKQLGQQWHKLYSNRGGDPNGRLYLEFDSLESVRFMRAVVDAMTPLHLK